MAGLEHVHLNRHAIDEAIDTALMHDLVTDAAREVARVARSLAPHRTGLGAASIDAWPGRDQQGFHADVSWDSQHYYMSFHEWGTSKITARHFLAEALDSYVHL